ncbi:MULTISPECIES: signal peptidase II [Aerococcus]|uniref:signal peptidase II n=1 Tax=Aerococcus TaxID=1375 RepID=UPI000DCC267D|nr:MULTISPECIES: signal peptidase II [Aerococcus]MDL5183569.1 signal peptidase II [Aerococcus mictus]MDK6291388.1 signal peptidase II [Aerococcus urinae]MDK6375828.1 signal peptidase II [Aerococcus urinae]MDK6421180.1 signal peptidase II [Aerococcus urinae]MDK8075483.1 signal peptidase II [Aerococcus urinae]
MFFYLLSIILVIIDQMIKAWTVNHIALNETIPFIPNLLSLHYLQNRGAAWGMLAGHMWLFIPITLLVSGLIIYYYHHDNVRHPLYVASLSLLLAGAVGNFIDRVRLGYVVDMFKLEFIDFPVFNFADTCLSLGVIFFIIYLLFFESKEE